MYKIRKTTKGFTIIELLLALSIGAMFSAIFFNFFFIHQKALSSTVIKSQLQMDMQQSVNYFSKSAMEASDISALNDINLGDVSTPQKLGVIGMVFSVKNREHEEQYAYKYRVEGKNLYYTPPGLAEKLICSDISYVQITPIDNKSFAECSGIVLEIELIGQDGKTTYNEINNMFYRNR